MGQVAMMAAVVYGVEITAADPEWRFDLCGLCKRSV